MSGFCCNILLACNFNQKYYFLFTQWQQSMIDSELFSILDVVDSTNNYAMGLLQQGKGKHGMACFARQQTKGKGQRGKSWQSAPDKNILLSIIIKPNACFIIKPFVFSAAIANFCREYLQQLVNENFVCKWPNDIYFGDKKTGGILIENIYRGNDWQWAIAGIGINVHQTNFEVGAAKAISLQQITPVSETAAALATALHNFILQKIESISEKNLNAVMQNFNENLYKKNEFVKLKAGNIIFETKIKAVNDFGQLETEDAIARTFNVGEVEWI